MPGQHHPGTDAAEILKHERGVTKQYDPKATRGDRDHYCESCASSDLRRGRGTVVWLRTHPPHYGGAKRRCRSLWSSSPEATRGRSGRSRTEPLNVLPRRLAERNDAAYRKDPARGPAAFLYSRRGITAD